MRLSLLVLVLSVITHLLAASDWQKDTGRTFGEFYLHSEFWSYHTVPALAVFGFAAAILFVRWLFS